MRLVKVLALQFKNGDILTSVSGFSKFRIFTVTCKNKTRRFTVNGMKNRYGFCPEDVSLLGELTK